MENIQIKHELLIYRMTVDYMNNQLTGRIQQVQLLLSKGKNDVRNFDQVWNDLVSEILLNKYKTITGALASNHQQTVANDHLLSLLSKRGPTSPIHEKFIKKDAEKEELLSEQDSSSLSDQNQSKEAKLNIVQVESNRSIDLDSEQSQIEWLKGTKLINFKQSWFNMGEIRFVFINLENDEALGVSIIVSLRDCFSAYSTGST